MSLTQNTNQNAGSNPSDAEPRSPEKPYARHWQIDKVTALAILAASAIFAPVAVAVLNQAAKIVAR